MRSRRRDAVAIEAGRDQVQTLPLGVLGEDAQHDRCRDRVGGELAELLAVSGLRRVGMWANVDQLITVGWPTAEEAPLDRGLGGHRAADAGLDPHPFTLRHAAIEGHHHVVGFGAGIDRATDLRHPQLDTEVREHREREPKLVSVEGALRLTNDDGVEATVGITERVEQSGGLGTALPRQ